MTLLALIVAAAGSTAALDLSSPPPSPPCTTNCFIQPPAADWDTNYAAYQENPVYANGSNIVVTYIYNGTPPHNVWLSPYKYQGDDVLNQSQLLSANLATTGYVTLTMDIALPSPLAYPYVYFVLATGSPSLGSDAGVTLHSRTINITAPHNRDTDALDPGADWTGPQRCLDAPHDTDCVGLSIGGVVGVVIGGVAALLLACVLYVLRTRRRLARATAQRTDAWPSATPATGFMPLSMRMRPENTARAAAGLMARVERTEAAARQGEEDEVQRARRAEQRRAELVEMRRAARLRWAALPPRRAGSVSSAATALPTYEQTVEGETREEMFERQREMLVSGRLGRSPPYEEVEGERSFLDDDDDDDDDEE